MTTHIRRAVPGDEIAITAMIHELAAFEKASEECTVTETQIGTALFGEHPIAHAHVAEVNGTVAATALWFLNFSTWDGVAGIYLEDLYVRPDFRRHGLSWAVLNWNVNAIALYDAVGGKPQTEWTTYRVSGAELTELARG